MATQQLPLLKCSVLHYRDKSHDEESWLKWYNEEQIPRFIPIAHKHGIDKVEIYFTPSTFKQLFQADLDQLKGGCAKGWNMAPYDAAVIYWFSDPERMRKMLSDPDWEGKVTKFEKGWIDQTQVDVQVGTQTTFLDGGKIINTVTKDSIKCTPQWLLLSDIHFRAHDLDRIQRTAQWIELLPQKHSIQRVVVCGDVLSSRTNQPTHVLSACYRFLSHLIDAVPRVDILLGNHDLAHRRDYTTTALDVLGIGRLAPFVQLHSAISSQEWDGRRVLVLPFREDQAELTQAVSRLEPRVAAETIAFAHLAIHKAVTQRHVVSPNTGESVQPIMHRGLTGPGHFARLARTFTGHFHSHQTMLQPDTGSGDRLRGSVTYIGSPLQLTWADLQDEQRGVLLLDPVTLQHELLANPYAVDFVTAELDKVLDGALDSDGVVGKHVMLTGELDQFKYVTARDKLLSHGARSVRNWSPMIPVLQSDHRADLYLLGATVPASDSGLSRTGASGERAEEAQSDTVYSEDEEPQEPNTVGEGSEEPQSTLQMLPLDLGQHAQEYVEALDLDPSLSSRRNDLIQIGRRLIQESGAATATGGEAPTPRYQDIIQATVSCSALTKSSTTKDTPNNAEARHIFVAQPLILTMTNFLGVQDTVKFNFIDLPHGCLALVVGRNGAGKSTILEAMTWCQFGRCVRTGLAVNDVVNDVAGRDCEVSLAFSNGYTITRYRKHRIGGNRVVVSLRGAAQTQLEMDTPRATQAAIDELLGIDFDAYIRTVVLGHESAAGFLSSTALQRRELIESALGLSMLDKLFDITRRMAKEVDVENSELVGQQEGLAQTIRHVENRMADLEKMREQVQSEALDMAKALGKAQEEMSMLQVEKDRIVEMMRQSRATADQALAGLQDQVNSARREVDLLKTSVQYAGIRIACDNEHSLAKNKLLEAERRLLDLRLAATGITSSSSWQCRVIRDTNSRIIRLQQWLRRRIQETDLLGAKAPHTITKGCRWFTVRFAPAFLVAFEYIGGKLRRVEANMEETKQRAVLEQLRGNIATAEQELSTLITTTERTLENVALAHQLDEEQVRQILLNMSSEEAREMERQYSIAESRLSLLMAECNQVMQVRMRQEQEDRERRIELEVKLAELGHNVTRMQNDMENKRVRATTYAQLNETEQQSMSRLRQEKAARDARAERLGSDRALLMFWESASSRRSTAARSSFRDYVLGKKLPELNSLVAQILTVLYDDTRHVRGMTSGMLRSLFQDPEDRDQDVQQTATGFGRDGIRRSGTVLDKTLGTNSALSYAKRSGGERKRIDLALFFALLHLSHAHSRHRARYLLVDEVFDSLDAAGQAVVVKWCRSSLMMRLDFALIITHSDYMGGGDGEGWGGEAVVKIETRMGERGTVFEVDR
ncbi:hypothetical protein VPNG_10120 [Cytospora leucostoma]|uniref:Rad50/SbcC-type AAA domain-containing protein n=1 Tax=Cytospora leucostoma TaxID=1230097 RepID=A0A423VEE4_9PEZI|nr:hypothetical protein VPNG_10120 [Cytospora leucostoma]